MIVVLSVHVFWYIDQLSLTLFDGACKKQFSLVTSGQCSLVLQYWKFVNNSTHGGHDMKFEMKGLH